MTLTKILGLGFAICLGLNLPTAGSAAETATTPASSERLMLGAGYPDLRLRGRLLGPLDLEAKLASDGAVTAYSGRLYWRAYAKGVVTLLAGAEAGAYQFSGVDGLDGSGSFYQPFVGLQARFAARWSAQLDAGPAFLQTRVSGIELGSQPWVLNAALYFSLF